MNTNRCHAISLLVHENLEVIGDQVLNFNKFRPKTDVLIHISASADFGPLNLENKLIEIGALNWTILKNQESTDWGRILPALRTVISYVVQAQCYDSLSFHASNDMLVRRGADQFIEQYPLLFESVSLDEKFLWSWSSTVRNDEWLASEIGTDLSKNIKFSQIEGSCYSLDALTSILPHLDRALEEQPSGPNYPAEEIYFPTFAALHGFKPQGKPYVLSESFLYHKELLRLASKIPIHGFFEPKNRLSVFLYKLLRQPFILRPSKYELTIDEICRVSEGLLSSVDVSLIYHNNKNKVYDTNHLFGVKRIPRQIDNELRNYIGSLP